MNAHTITASSAGARNRAPRPRTGDHSVTTALLLATAAGPDGAAAALPWEGASVLRRLIDQLADLGVREAHVVTRPQWEGQLREPAAGAALHTSPDPAGDLALVADLARRAEGGLVVISGDIVTQREALAGLLIDPRVTTGVLVTNNSAARPFGFRARANRGRVISAASPYHAVHAPTTTFLNVLKVAPAERERVARAAERLIALVSEPSAQWRDELTVKEHNWSRALKRIGLTRSAEAAGVEREPLTPEQLDELPLPEGDRRELARRLAAAGQDITALLLVALVRDGGAVAVSPLRSLFWARPLDHEDVERAAEEVTHHDEDKALLDSAVKASDGFFTTYFVSPYSRYIARWAARRGFTPNQVTSFSVLIGLISAVLFATGERWGLIAGAVMLQAAFTFDCVDGQLARYTRTFTKLGAWLDSIFDRTKEYLVFAGLAIGASRAGDDVWLLAGAALALQTARHAIDFSYPATLQQALKAKAPVPLEQPSDGAGRPADEDEDAPVAPEVLALSARQRAWRAWRQLNRTSKVRWIKKMIQFPIGERFAAISLTAALFDARVTFIVLLAWGGLAASYVIAGRLLGSVRALLRFGTTAPTSELLPVYHDDGPLAAALARRLALPARLQWIAPPVLRAIEFGGLLWCAWLAGDSSLPAAFALLCALAWRHYDTVYRLRYRGDAPPRAIKLAAGGGWELRLALGFALLAAGALPGAFWVAAVALMAVLVGESVSGWTGRRAAQPEDFDDDEQDEEAAE